MKHYGTYGFILYILKSIYNIVTVDTCGTDFLLILILILLHYQYGVVEVHYFCYNSLIKLFIPLIIQQFAN